MASIIEDGTLDLLATSPLPPEAVYIAKAAAHWLTTGLPLALAAPVLGVLLNLDFETGKILCLSLLLGTPALSLIGAFGASLTLGVKRGGLLLSLLVLPLYVPSLIFGAQAVRLAGQGLAYDGALVLLSAISLGAAAILPFASGAALRINSKMRGAMRSEWGLIDEQQTNCAEILGQVLAFGQSEGLYGLVWSGSCPGLRPRQALSLCSGLIWGYFLTPDDMRQGSTVKIIYLHVPAALMAINGYLLMFVGALVWLIRRQHVSVLAAKAAAPVGMVMTLIALATGAIWGQPMWGTYWVWDPRLTSFLILFLFYVGYIALWAAIEDEDTAADLTSVLAIVGAVFAMLSRYAVLFWNQGLHQGTTVTVADGAKQENISNVFFQPLLLSMAGFGLLFLTLLLVGTRTEVRSRRLKVLQARERME